MCVIIDKPEGLEFPEGDILSACEVNPEGFGWMTAKNGSVQFGKTTDFTPEDIVKFMDKMKDQHALFHFRFNTAGETNQENCHPFKVLDRKKDGKDLLLMHNGTISNCKPDFNASKKRKQFSDTRIFSEEVLRPLLLKYGIGALTDKIILELLEDYIGGSSKVALLDGSGNVFKLNGEEGSERHGCWVSNQYSFNRSHRKPYQTPYTPPSGIYGGNTGPGGTWETTLAKLNREKREATAKAAEHSVLCVCTLCIERKKKEKKTVPVNLVTQDGKQIDTQKKETKATSVPDTPFKNDAEKEAKPPPLVLESELAYYLEHLKFLTMEDVEGFLYDNPSEGAELLETLLEMVSIEDFVCSNPDTAIEVIYELGQLI